MVILLKIINEALKGNGEIVEVGRKEETSLPMWEGQGFHHQVDIFIGLAKPSYDARLLQHIMMDLVSLPPPKPGMRDDFCLVGDSKYMSFGRLSFDEIFGAVKISVEDYDKKMFQPGEGEAGNYTLKRRITIRLYPNQEIAHKAYRASVGTGDEKNFKGDKMSLKDLAAYQTPGNIFSRFFSRFK